MRTPKTTIITSVNPVRVASMGPSDGGTSEVDAPDRARNFAALET
ncbi:MAG: hypothetical protein RLN84_01200 [Rhodospirillaceae bacterium]